ncbi:trehalose synthase [Halodesulfovibrio marinisediminis DSM 17456]|uniref:Trehalose synthase n=2 Tax=Halodesulfovibrio marinisediminis TaxID=458711 RepID=A0A1N6DH37_9BACT|nr:trehalose synthase [Halodesulfovibrio marinisediminis DSM 17456]
MKKKKYILLLVGLLMILSGCSAPKVGSSNASSGLSMETEIMGRANPGYVQWLEKQAMLNASEKLSTVVSGTNLFWLGPYEKPRVDMMLKIAPVWVTFDAARTISASSVLLALQSDSYLRTMQELGIRGIHITSMRENGVIWGSPTEQRQLGDDTVSYNFSKGFGNEKGFNTFLRKANKQGIIVGDTVIPFATGRGADYFLTVRGVESYKGLYCMVEVPRELWKHLPEITTRARAVSVDENSLKALRRARVLPPPLVRESLDISLTPLNWYATDVVKGLDGNSRRFVYLGYGSEARPVLNWSDPSKAAQRLISGSLIQEIGLLHVAMTSVRVSPLYGLEPSYPNADMSGFGVGDTAVQAARDIAQEARRYGGWTFLEDNLPLPDIKAATEGGVDFALNHALSTSAQYAYATGDASLLRQSLYTILQMGIDPKRFINRIQPESYIDFSFPFMFNPEQKRNSAISKQYLDTVREKIAVNGGDVFFAGKKLYLTPAAFVATVQGIRNFRNLTEEQRHLISSGLTLLGHTQAMQPGIFMLSADELLGVLPLPAGLLDYTDEEDALRQNIAGGYDFTSRGGSNILTEIGLPKAPTAFDDLGTEVRMVESFAGNMRRIIKLRNALGIQDARVVQLPKAKNKGVLVQVFQLPKDNSMKATIAVNVINFGEHTATEEFSLLKTLTSGEASLEELLTGETVSGGKDGFIVTVPARTAQTYVVRSAE